MKCAPFTYHRPGTEAEALQMLGSLEGARVLAGGQSLMPMLNLRYAAPEHLVDINRITSLVGTRLDGQTLRIGAMTRQCTLIDDPVLARRCPILREALLNVGHLPTRARGTYGGSLAHLDPASEQPGIAALHDATIMLRSQGGDRSVDFVDYPQGYYTPDIQSGELLVEVSWTLWPEQHGWSFLEFAHRPGDFAVVGVGVLISLQSDASTIARAALVLVGVDNAPVRAHAVELSLIGQTADPSVLEAAAVAVAECINPVDDASASAAYRRRLARVLTRRALTQAVERAQHGMTTT